MKIGTIKDLLGAQVSCCEEGLSRHVYSACGSDMMSDVLAYVKDQAVLLTGLVNLQVVRTAEMIELAKDCGMVILATDKRMYEACGILYSNGLVGNRVKNA